MKTKSDIKTKEYTSPCHQIINLLFPQWNDKQKAELYAKLNNTCYICTGAVDIFTLDEALMAEYPEYGMEMFSMKAFIAHLVGKEKALEIEELMNI